jgi:N-carbamoylputrescine amidase
MKVTVCQLDNRPGRLDAMLAELAAHIDQQQSEFLLLPEMCFHEWLAAGNNPDR